MPRTPSTLPVNLPPWADSEAVREDFSAWLVAQGSTLSTADAYARMASQLLAVAVDPAALERRIDAYKPQTATYARSVLRKAHAWAAARHPTWKLPAVPRPRTKAPAPVDVAARMGIARRRWCVLVAYLGTRLYVGSTTLHRARVGWLKGRAGFRQWVPEKGRTVDLHEGDALVIAALVRLGYGYARTASATDPLLAVDGKPVSRQTAHLGLKLGREIAPRGGIAEAVAEAVEAITPGHDLAIFRELDADTLVHRPGTATEPEALVACEHGHPRDFCPTCLKAAAETDGHDATRSLLAAWGG